MSLISCFLLIFTTSPKLICPILLCHNQLSSICPIQHFSSFMPFRMDTKEFSSLFFSLARLTIPFPTTLKEALSPKVMLPPFYFFRLRNLFWSLDICFKHPLSMYHWLLFFQTHRANSHYSLFLSSYFLFHILVGFYLCFYKSVLFHGRLY